MFGAASKGFQGLFARLLPKVSRTCTLPAAVSHLPTELCAEVGRTLQAPHT